MAPRVRTNPLNLETPISKEGGSPTPFFVRQWQSLLDLVSSLITIQQEIIKINDATITAGTGLGGGGQISSGAITIDLEDTAVAPGAYTAANITVDQQGRLTAAANGSAGIRVEDEGGTIVAAATGLNFAGAGVTVTDAGGGEALVTIPGGGSGGGWTLRATQALTSGSFYDFVGLAGSTDILVLCVQATRTLSGILRVFPSIDNGATFLNASGACRSITATGVDAVSTGFPMYGSASAATRSGFVLIHGCNTVAKKLAETNDLTHYLDSTTAAVNAIRFDVSGGTFTGGTVYVFTR